MASLFETIMGGGDQTPDPTSGLTNADRSQLGFDTLGRMGALLMAAGEPMYGPDRARYLAAMAGIPGQVQEQRGQMVQQHRIAQTAEMERRTNDAARQIQAAGQTLDTANLTPQQALLLKSAYATGNPASIIAAQKEIREQTQPIPGAGGNVMVRKPDGGWLITNPTNGINFELDAQGRMVGNPNGPGIGPAYDARLKRIINGDEAFPSARDPLRARILGDLPADVREQDYAAKQQAIKAITNGGKDFENILRPAQAYLEHASKLAEVTDKLVERGIISDDWADRNGGNYVRLLKPSLYSKEDQQLITKWQELKGKVADEASKFTRGNGALTDQAQREGNGLKEATAPAAIRGHIGGLNDIMHGQVGTVADTYRNALKRPSMQPIDLLQPQAREAYDRVAGWMSGGKMNPGAQQAAPAQSAPAPAQGGEQPPMPGARKAPDGKWYVQKDGKYFEVR